MAGYVPLKHPLEVCLFQALFCVISVSTGLRTRPRTEQAYNKC